MPSNIEYLDETWNPTTGCSHAGSPGCDHCWARAMTERFGEAWGYDFKPRFHENRLEIPLRWKKPRRIGVSFMGDLFHKNISLINIARVFDEIIYCYHANRGHTFFILTKRPERISDFVHYYKERLNTTDYGIKKVFQNLYLGASVEDQKSANKRIPYLLRMGNLFKLWISVEPILGSINLKDNLGKYFCVACGWKGNNPHTEALGSATRFSVFRWCPKCMTAIEGDGKTIEHPSIDWVIVGGEAGHGARSMHPNWARALRDQCIEADVPFFFKQWGEWIHSSQCITDDLICAHAASKSDYRGDLHFAKVGKKAAGRKLDGQIWDQMPK